MAEQRRRSGHGGGGFGAPAEKAKDFKGTIKKLMSFARAYTLQIAMVMVFAIGSTIFTIAGPKILGKATTELGKGLGKMIAGTGGINFHRIGVILGILLGMYAVSALFSFIQGWLMTGVSQKMCYNLRDAISKKLNRLPISYYESRNVGEILSRITNDVDTLQMSLNQCITQLITSVTTVIGILIMMLSISPIMTLIAIVILPLSGMMVGLVVKKSQKYFVAQQKYLGKINGQIEEVYSGQNIVKAFNSCLLYTSPSPRDRG